VEVPLSLAFFATNLDSDLAVWEEKEQVISAAHSAFAEGERSGEPKPPNRTERIWH